MIRRHRILGRHAVPAALFLSLACVVACWAAGTPLHAQAVCTGSNLGYFGSGNDSSTGTLCSGFVCQAPVLLSTTYTLAPGCDPTVTTCGITANVAFDFTGNHGNSSLFGFGYSFEEFDLDSTGGSLVGECGFAGEELTQDLGTAVVTGSVRCGTPSSYVLKAISCPVCPTCPFTVVPPACQATTPVTLDFTAQAGCPTPPPENCNEADGDPSGAAGPKCTFCRAVGGSGGNGGGAPGAGPGGPTMAPAAASGDPGGPPCAVGLDGNAACTPAWSGPGALLRYATGGVGLPSLPGSSGSNPWNTTLGRYWSHEHAERIVIDNPTTGTGNVWLLTRYGSFRQFTALGAAAPGSSLRAYGANSPSDEFRTLYYDDPAGSPAGTGNWLLKGLDGTVETFRPDGLWIQTSYPADASHPVTATYGTGGSSSQLQAVNFPDGRSESYTYYGTGKLQTIVENAVGGAAARTWTYVWSGDHLTNIQRPDGTSWEMTYGTNGAPPDALSQLRLIGTDGTTGRVTAAFAYTGGLVTQSWRGDPSYSGPNAVDQQTYTYTGSPVVTQTQVAQVVSGTYINHTTYNLGRDTVSNKVKILSLNGDCPTCGLAPNTSFEYTATGGTYSLLPSAMVDGRGIRTEYSYDASGHGRLIERRDAVVGGTPLRKIDFLYDTNFPGLVKEVDRPSTAGGTNLRTSQWVHDPTTSLVTSSVIGGIEAAAPYSLTTTYTYNGSGHLTQTNPPDELNTTADATGFSYNVVNAGRNGYVPDSRTDPVVGTTQFVFDSLNRLSTSTDINGLLKTVTYDGLGRVTSTTEQGPVALQTQYLFDCPAGSPAGVCGPFRDLRCIQMPAGNGIAFLYDAAGRLIETRRQADCGSSTQAIEHAVLTRDGAGNVIEEDHEHWDSTMGSWVTDQVVQYVFTCRLDKQIAGPKSGSGSAISVTEYCYDEDENLKQLWDANHPRASFPSTPSEAFTYDNLNRLTQVARNWSGAGGTTAVTQYTYDVQDNLTQVTDAEGNVTGYTMSDRGLRTKQISPVSGTTTYAYNYHGQLATRTDSRGIVTTRTQDQADRTSSLGLSDGTPTVTYTYDLSSPPANYGKGRLGSITQSGNTTSFAYDQFGRLTQDGTLAFQYDANGNRSAVTYPGGVTASYGFDASNRPSTLSYNAGAGAVPVVTQVRYLADGPLASMTLASGATELHAFDQRYFPQSIQVTGATPLNWAYTVDQVGNVTQINDGSTLRTYGFEPNVYFLNQTNGPWGAKSWTYDRIGNRLSEVRGATTDTYTYAGGHVPKLTGIALGAGGARSYSYDAAGNEVQVASPSTVLDLAYNGANQLTRATDEAASAGTTFQYDGRNFLAQSSEGTNLCSPVVTQATYSSDGLFFGNATKNLLTGAVSSDNLVLYFAGRPVGFLSISGTPTLRYVAVDHLGTPILETTSTAGALWSGGFEPFGRDWNAAQSAGELLRFPGQWEDPSWSTTAGGGFDYNLNRWYDASTGRYSQPDPLGLRGGINLYAYVSANPLTGIDRLGLCPKGKCPDCPGGNWIGTALLGEAEAAFDVYSVQVGIGGLVFAGVMVCTSNPLFNAPIYSYCSLGAGGREQKIGPKLPSRFKNPFKGPSGHVVAGLAGLGISCSGFKCREDLGGLERGFFGQAGAGFIFVEGSNEGHCVGAGAGPDAGFYAGGFVCNTLVGDPVRIPMPSM